MLFGIIHLLHCPCLILYAYVTDHFDFLYILYFFGIMFSYTFINGECPISYIYKKWKDPEYIAGSRIADYPEMQCIFGKQNKLIQFYFGTNTVLYIGSLLYVIHRSNIPFIIFIIPTNSLSFYFYFIYFYRIHPLFYIIQNVVKIILFSFILCLIRREI
jgi:hypothetical protein